MRSAHLAAQRDEEHAFALAGTEIVVDPSGALYWPEERMLVVADLHLEKGSAFAKRGVLLPPYDTASTLARLAGVLHGQVGVGGGDQVGAEQRPGYLGEPVRQQHERAFGVA